MSNIQENLQKILTAVWGRDVRQAIHDAIHDCYEDASSGTTDLPARERIDALETNSATKTELQAEVTARTAGDADINTTIGTVAMGTTAVTLKGAIKELLQKINTNEVNIGSHTTAINNLITKIGSVAMGTTATTVTGAVKELLTKINTTNSNLSTTNSNVTSVSNRTTALETKTAGIVRTVTFNIDANSKGYRQLHALNMYLMLVNGGTVSNAIRGAYLIGVTSGNAIGIKEISPASSVVVEDYGSGLLKIQNNASLTLRVTLILTYGT